MEYGEVQPFGGYQDLPTASHGLSGAPLIFVVVLGIAVYIYTAYCLSAIAKKTGTPNEWWAWIPVLNILLMLKVARLPLWWALGFLVAFIPLVNLLVLALVAYIWWKVAERLNRPGWWGILMLIGPINLVLLWFLAFKEAAPQPSTPAPTAPTPPTTPAA